MSDSARGAQAVEHTDALPEWALELRQEVKEVRAENEHLRARLDEVERTSRTNETKLDRGLRADAEFQRGATISWDDEDGKASNIVITNSKHGTQFPLGAAVEQKLPENPYKKIVDDVEELVYDLARGEVDPTDLVGATGDEYELPIEETVAKVRNEMAEDPSANKMRATVVFRAFGGRARSMSGKMVLESGDVKNILQDPKKCGMSNPNPRTVGRTMEQCAKLTSTKPEEDRDPWDPENLLTMEKRNGRRALVADRDEWLDYTDGVQERING